MESQSELVGGEQNNQTVQPLVADENDQNVKSKADGKKKAKSPGTDKKCRDKKKRKTEATEKQLEETRSKIDELEKFIAYLNGKLEQAEKDMERQNATRKTEDMERQLEEMRSEIDELKKKVACLNGKLDQAKEDRELKQVAEPQNATRKNHDGYLTNMFFKFTLAYLSGKLDLAQKYWPIIRGYMERKQEVEQSALTDGGLTHGGDLINYISLPREAMASGSSLMQEGLLALGGQPVAGRTGFGTLGPFDFHHPATGSTMELGGPDIQELLCPSHEVERAHRNTVEQPALSYDGLAQGGGLLGSHGLYYTSPPGAAMASGSSPMQGSLAPGGQAYLSFEVTGFGTGETGLPVHHPPIHQCGTTMGSGGLAVEDSPGLPQPELSQEWMHLPSFGIGDQESTSSIENLPMLSISFLENFEKDWIEDEYNAPTRML